MNELMDMWYKKHQNHTFSNHKIGLPVLILVSSEMFILSFIRRVKSSKFVCLMLKPDWFSWFGACAVSVIKTGK
jgi:hypothetical protein